MVLEVLTVNVLELLNDAMDGCCVDARDGKIVDVPADSELISVDHLICNTGIVRVDPYE